MKNLNRLAMSVLVTGVLLSSCQKNNEQQQQWGAEGPQPYPLITIATADGMLSEDYPAVIEGRENVEIRPKVDGFIEKIYIDEGASVRKGQLLFKINAPQYEQEVNNAHAAIQSAESSVNTAKMQVQKTEPLVAKGILNQYALQEAKYALEEKQAVLLQIKTNLANAKNNIGYTMIHSPIDGVIGSIPYKTGSLVSSASPQPLTTVSDISNLYAYFSMDEKKFLDFSDGQDGKSIREKLQQYPPVTLVLANGKEHSDKGKLETIGGLINSTTGAATLRAGFKNPGNRIRSGSSAIVRIARPYSKAVVVPQSATYEVQDKKFVYVVGKDGLVKSREIKVNSLSNGQVYVIESGLASADQIVSDGMGNLRDGMKIIPTDPSKMAQPAAY